MVDILSLEFIEFSEKVKDLYAKKEELNASFKEVYLKHKKDIEDLDAKANALKAQFLGN